MALSTIKLQKGKLQESIFIRTVPLYYIKCEEDLYRQRQKQAGSMKSAKVGSGSNEYLLWRICDASPDCYFHLG